MKKIGLYLSVGPHSGGSFQYCLSVIKYLQSLDSKIYKIQAFISNDVWKNKLNKNFDVIRLNKKFFFEKYLNYLGFFLPNNVKKIFF